MMTSNIVSHVLALPMVGLLLQAEAPHAQTSIAPKTGSAHQREVGWHTFRRMFSSLLKANGEDLKVVQELMRHGNPITTMRDYTQPIPQHLRDAQKRVVEMVLKAKAPGAAAPVLCNVP